MTTDLLPDGETLLVYPSTPYTLPLDFGEDITGRTFTASYGEAAATVEANGTDGLFVSFTSAARGRSALLIVETTVTPRAFLRFPIDVSAATGSGSSAPFTVNAPDDLTITVTPVAGLVAEAAQDLVGSMFTGNTETGISATYNDGTGKIDLVAEVTQAEVDGLATSIASAIASGDATTLASAGAYTDGEIADEVERADSTYAPVAVVLPTGDLTGAGDTAAIAAAVDRVVAGDVAGIHFAPGIFRITSGAGDFSTEDALYSATISGSGNGGTPMDVNPHGTQIWMLDDNVPIFKMRGGQKLRDLTLIYETQQTSAQTGAIGLSLNGIAGASIRNVDVWQGCTNIGIPQTGFGGASNTMFDTDLCGVRSYRASLCHFDLRNFNGGGTNVRLGPLYANGGGSLDFVTAGQGCTHVFRGANWNGYELGAASADGMELTGSVLEVASGQNLFTVNTIRAEAINFKTNSQFIVDLGGSDNIATIGSVDHKNCRWTPAAPSALYLVAARATRNILSIGTLRVQGDCDFGVTGVRRAMTVTTTDAAGGDIKVGSVIDPDPQLSDTLWTETATLQSPVREWMGRFVNRVRQAGRSTNTHRQVIATALPTTDTWAVDDEVVMDVITPGRAVAYRCITAGVGAAAVFRSIAQTVARGTTASRPSPSASEVGLLYLDNTLDSNGRPIFWNGSAFVDPAAMAQVLGTPEYRIHGWRDVTARSAWTQTLTAGVVAGARYDLSPAGTTPGYLEWSVWLPAGTYRCLVDAVAGTLFGIGEVLIDGNTFGTFDCYQTTTMLKSFRLATTRAVTEGVHTIRLAKTGTKNASAGEHWVAMHEIALIRS